MKLESIQPNFCLHKIDIFPFLLFSYLVKHIKTLIGRNHPISVFSEDHPLGYILHSHLFLRIELNESKKKGEIIKINVLFCVELRMFVWPLHEHRGLGRGVTLPPFEFLSFMTFTRVLLVNFF
jgi:hypothetical protein